MRKHRGTARRAMMFLLLAGTAAAGWSGADGAVAQVYAIALPDISSKRLAVRPETVEAGGTVEIINAVQNRGAGALTPAHGEPDAPATLTIRFLLVRNVRDETGTLLGSWSLDALDRKKVERHAALWTVPLTVEPGEWFLCADVDPENAVRESNELNNRTCLPLTVKPAPQVASGEFPLPEGDAGTEAEEQTEEAEEETGPGFSGLDEPEDAPRPPQE